MRKRVLVGAMCAVGAALVLLRGGSISAESPKCDFTTSGGFITNPTVAGGDASFGASGGCKDGSFWGSLEYQDHGSGNQLHGTVITSYQMTADNARLICGTGDTPQGAVSFLVRVKDRGEPGTLDEFDIRWQGPGGTYTTFGSAAHKVVSGGNIQLHNPNSSTSSGSFGGTCPADTRAFMLTVALQSVNGGSGMVTSEPPGIECTLVIPQPPSAPFQTGSCFAPFAAGTTVKLTATSSTGASVTFSNSCQTVVGSFPPQCTVTMNADVTVTATFTGGE